MYTHPAVPLLMRIVPPLISLASVFSVRFAGRRLSVKMTSNALVDFDCNLLHPDLSGKMDYHVSQAGLHANVQTFVVPGSCLEDSVQALALAKAQGPSVIATAGVHPYSAASDAHSPEAVGELERMIVEAGSDCKGVGETGLDYSDGFPEKAAQVSLSLRLRFKGIFLYIIGLCFMWSAALDSSGLPLSYPVISLA